MRKCNDCSRKFADHSGFKFCPFDASKLESIEMSTLFVVHCSEVFTEYCGIGYIQSVTKLINDYDLVIYLNCNDIAPLPDCFGSQPNEQVWEFAWGYEPTMFDGEEVEFVIESSGHEFTWIPKEIRCQPKLGDITVIGGSVNECLADWESILNHLGYSHKRHSPLCW